MNGRVLHRLCALLALAAVLAMVGCSTGNSSDDSTNSESGEITGGPGVDLETKTITIGDVAAISGPAAANGKAALAGSEVAVKAINDAGGVDGFKLKLEVEDGGYAPQSAVAAFNGMKDDVAIALNFGSATTKAILPAVKAANMVVLPLSWDSEWSSERNLAPLGTPYAHDTANALDYLSRVKGLGKKVGIIYQNDAYGQDGLHGFKAAVEAGGLTNVGEAPQAVGDTDFTAQVQKMKAAGAEIVVLSTLPGATGAIVGTAATLGYEPTFLLQGPAYLELLITKTGALDAAKTPIAANLAKNAYVMSFATPWGNEKAPGMKDMLAAVERYAPEQIPGVYFTYSWAQTHLAAAILRKAIENKDLSREGILDARLNLGTFDSGGLAPTLTYTPELGPPSTKSIINRIDPSVVGFLEPVVAGYEGPTAESL